MKLQSRHYQNANACCAVCCFGAQGPHAPHCVTLQAKQAETPGQRYQRELDEQFARLYDYEAVHPDWQS